LDVLEFMPVAEKNIPPAHWGYLMTGSDDDRTRDLNNEAYQQIAIRPRRFNEALNPDTHTSLLGVPLSSPMIICPISAQRAFHPEGEAAVARAAAAKDHLICLSGSSSTT